ncbi:MAG: hypothetical protein HOO96_05185 [Polyangiaceae bacterium]|nr:hypothetical protein [Polyangiaceae bacterium]
MTTTLTVSFLAPVAVGAEIVVVTIEEAGVFSGWNEAAPILVDRSTGIVFGSSSLPEQIHAGDLDVERHSNGRFRRAPDVAPVTYRVASCLIRSRSGDHANLNTVLGLEPLAGTPAYR